MRVSAIAGILLVFGLVQGASADELPSPTCAQFKAGYDILADQPISTTNGRIADAIMALADNHLIYSDATMTAFATREQLAAYLGRLQPIEALIWLQARFTDIENRLKTAKCPFEEKRLVLLAPTFVPKPGAKSCGGPMPDLSKPLKK